MTTTTLVSCVFRTLQLQDIPVGSAVSDVAKAWVDEKFVPDFDEYALAKVIAARPGANIVTWDGTTIDTGVNGLLQKFYNTVTVVTNGGGDTGQSIAWVPVHSLTSFVAYITTSLMVVIRVTRWCKRFDW